jgi:hypothetical protein
MSAYNPFYLCTFLVAPKLVETAALTLSAFYFCVLIAVIVLKRKP